MKCLNQFINSLVINGSLNTEEQFDDLNSSWNNTAAGELFTTPSKHIRKNDEKAIIAINIGILAKNAKKNAKSYLFYVLSEINHQSIQLNRLQILKFLFSSENFISTNSLNIHKHIFLIFCFAKKTECSIKRVLVLSSINSKAHSERRFK